MTILKKIYRYNPISLLLEILALIGAILIFIGFAFLALKTKYSPFK